VNVEAKALKTRVTGQKEKAEALRRLSEDSERRRESRERLESLDTGSTKPEA
jgi:hypothetical protein